MNNICRLCLTVSNQMTCKLSEESDVLRKIYMCLFLHISLDENLPSSICSDCERKIEEISYFQQRVTENQNILDQHLNNGINDLENFYLSLKTGLNVKEEFKEIQQLENVNFNIALKNESDEKQNMVIKEQKVSEKIINCSSNDDASQITKDVVKNKKKPVKNNLKFKKTYRTAKKSTPAKENKDSLASEDKKIDSKHKCLTCFALFESRFDLGRHYRQEHGKNVVVDNCFSIIKKEGRNVTYKCDKCDKVCLRKKEMRKHMIAHSEVRPFVCNICGKAFKIAGQIMTHGQRVHEGVYRFECMYECGFSTAYKAHVQDHERKHRAGEFRFKCETCGKGFQIRKDFEEHDNVHKGIRPYVCHICGNSFHASKYLHSHRVSSHPLPSELKRFICVHCSLPCSSKGTLRTHLKEHGIVKSYLCDFCGKSLTTLCSYKAHRRLHLGEKPFSCSTCGKSFTDKKTLVLHERTHTGERRYACKVCGKRYTQRSTLAKHMRQHEGWEESLECSKCQRAFAYRSQVVSHEKVCGNTSYESCEGLKPLKTE